MWSFIYLKWSLLHVQSCESSLAVEISVISCSVSTWNRTFCWHFSGKGPGPDFPVLVCSFPDTWHQDWTVTPHVLRVSERLQCAQCGIVTSVRWQCESISNKYKVQWVGFSSGRGEYTSDYVTATRTRTYFLQRWHK